MASTALMLASIMGSQAYAQNPADASGLATATYLSCLLDHKATTPRAAARALVEQCGYKPDQPVDEFVDQAVAQIPKDPLAPITQQLAPLRDLYSDEQYAYFEQLDEILAGSASFDEMSNRLAGLEQQALTELGRSDRDLNVLGSISAARYTFEFIRTYQGTGVVAKGFWRDLRRVGELVAAVAVGFAIAGPIGGALAGWAAIALMETDP
ncbi:hypothetical protein [Lysobacter capsici]|uniref:hypothetical protein n=1 Tax=Lysobacter capsici TaxID=435897 RepID=UPI001C003F2F|nr:hypothetical protein [Lysobacter capsici]MBW8807340.1 hypothetical protein [Lysobacter sp.]QWF17063.1 hypothetical protein KME82_25595 [Lysobacter capsici]